MKTFLLVVMIFWIGTGLMTLKLEMEAGNQKLLKAKGWPKIFLKSLLYGPYTRSKVLAKL
jgi:hypothetical protein